MKLLLEIDAICKEHKIEYFLEYGTVLGAIRHEGFIPWDNDIDISMAEDDYNRFVEVCKHTLDHKTRTFCDNRRNREFPTVFGRYIDLEVCRLSKKQAFWRNLCGQSIDVFCRVELPGDKEEKKKAITRFFAYDEFVNRSYAHYRRKTDEIVDLYHSYLERAKESSYEAVCEELEAEIFGHTYEDCDTVLVASARMGNPTPFFPKRFYEDPIRVPFEGHEFTITKDYVELMTMCYGDDFNRFPPSLRIHSEMSHTGYPCRVYVNDFVPCFDLDEMKKDRESFKELGMEEGLRMEKINASFYGALGMRVCEAINRQIKEKNLDVAALVSSRDPQSLETLDDLFSEYFEKQLHPDVLYWRVHFGLSDDLEYAAMHTLLMQRNNRRAIDKLFVLRGQNDLEPTSDMLHLQKAMSSIRRIKKYMIEKDYPNAKAALEESRGFFPESKEVQLWELRYDTATADSDEACEACVKKAQDLLEVWPEDEYCIKAIGDIRYRQGDYAGAKEMYAVLSETTNDGLLLFDIAKKEPVIRAQLGEA